MNEPNVFKIILNKYIQIFVINIIMAMHDIFMTLLSNLSNYFSIICFPKKTFFIN